MKTIRNRYLGRGHGRRGFDAETRDEFSDVDMEDSRRNEDYYFRHDRGSGYTNRDHSGGNYWPSNEALRRQRDVYEGSYVPSFDYGPHRDHPRHRRTSGYGDDYSPAMREYRRWVNDEPEGYRGRNSADYTQDYEEQYNPGDYDRGGARRNYEAEHYNRWAEEDRHRHHDGTNDYRYGEYQSYPAYADNRDRDWPRRSRHFRNRPGRHRPNIREKRY